MVEFYVSCCPITLCNMHCNWCYLTKDQLRDNSTLDLDVLTHQLSDLNNYNMIKQIDVYGGEISTLSDGYLEELFNVLSNFSSSVNVITNLSRISPTFLDDRIELSVSLDGDEREHYSDVLNNIISISKDIHILTLASKGVIEWTDSEIVSFSNMLSTINNVVSVEIKPYSSNQSNQDDVTYADYENFVKRWIDLNHDYSYQFINIDQIKQSLAKEKNAWSDDHIYIMPDGKFHVLDFDLNDNEYFQSMDDITEYRNWCKKEKEKVGNNQFCNQCKYFGHCLSEHLRDVKDTKNSCNGFSKLLDWYDTRT